MRSAIITATKKAALPPYGEQGKTGPTYAERIVPPRPPTPSTRKPRPYSTDDLDALLATTMAFFARVLVTLKAPPGFRIVDWPTLRNVLETLKQKLENLRARNRFPSSLTVTEFDPVEVGEVSVPGASFHIVFAGTLSQEQQDLLKHWWLALMELRDNQGRAFQYDDKQGGPKLQEYIAKDVDFRGEPRPVKFRPDWLPEHTDCRLWFVIGMKRRPASEGRALRAQEGKRRKSFEGAQGRKRKLPLRVKEACSESEQGCAYITAESKAVAFVNGDEVKTCSEMPVTLPPSAERLTMHELWESSPLLMVKETVKDVMDDLPRKHWRIVLSFCNSMEHDAVALALSLHRQGLLILAYTDTRQRLICLTSEPWHIGEQGDKTQLIQSGERPVYYQR